jgi:hypothetical protein
VESAYLGLAKKTYQHPILIASPKEKVYEN